MLNLKYILSHPKESKKRLATRGIDTAMIDQVIELGNTRSHIMQQLESLQRQRNELSAEVGILKQNKEDTSKVLEEVSKIKVKLESFETMNLNVQNDLKDLLLSIPNLPSEKTPVGEDESENKLIEEFDKLGKGKVKAIKAHHEIAVELNIVDFKRAVKLSGTRYAAYVGHGAKLVRALETFMIDQHVANGYLEIMPPVIVKASALQGTGQLPKFGEDLFKIENSDSYLIPTGEVPLTNFYAGEIIDLESPVKLVAYTQCFRSEAGSAGKDTKGLIRTHQFNKVELVKIVKKEDVDIEFEKTVNDAASILELLELPYKKVQLCTGDIGFTSEETIDLEVWIPSEQKYREISSISSFGDFQGRRASIRYKNSNNKRNTYAYTINGSGLAIDRTIAAMLENYQNEDGSVDIPKVLIPYMNSSKLIK